MTITEIKEMSTIERIQTMELLWDALSHENEDKIVSPAWHEEVLKLRKKKIESGETKFISFEQLKKLFS